MKFPFQTLAHTSNHTSSRVSDLSRDSEIYNVEVCRDISYLKKSHILQEQRWSSHPYNKQIDFDILQREKRCRPSSYSDRVLRDPFDSNTKSSYWKLINIVRIIWDFDWLYFVLDRLSQTRSHYTSIGVLWSTRVYLVLKSSRTYRSDNNFSTSIQRYPIEIMSVFMWFRRCPFWQIRIHENHHVGKYFIDPHHFWNRIQLKVVNSNIVNSNIDRRINDYRNSIIIETLTWLRHKAKLPFLNMKKCIQLVRSSSKANWFDKYPRVVILDDRSRSILRLYI